MPKTKISDYSQTAASNTDINSINLAEGMLPSDVNNAIRELMKQLKDFQVGAQGDPMTIAGSFVSSGGAVLSGTNTLSGSTVLTASLGSSASPSVHFSGDTNTGIFSPTADTIAFTEGGAESMRIDSSGNVGIGTTSAGSKLDVKGTLRLSGSTSGYVGLAPAAAAGSTTYTLPSADGTNGQLLSTNGSGTLSWASGGGSSLDGDTDSATPFETSLGNGAGAVNTGVNNTFVGFEAGNDNTTGTDNTAIGYQALDVNTTGANNTAVGSAALGANTTGARNTAVGSTSLSSNTTGERNTAVGYAALSGNSTGQQNTAMGYGALGSNTTQSQNTAFGYIALNQATSTDNTGVGWQVFYNVTTGTGNTGVGINAGLSVTTGSNNLLLGDSAGRTASPSGNITTGSNIVCLGNNNITDLYCADTTISSSDARDKTDVQDFTHGLDWITKLRPVTYRWDKRAWYVGSNPTTEDIINAKPDGSKKQNRLNIGFLAQEEIAVEKEFGYAETWETMLVAAENEDGSAYGLKYERLVPVLVNAIKQLKAEVDSLKSQINGA